MKDTPSPSTVSPSAPKQRTLYELLRLGPVVVGEVRGFKSEIGKKFDKSDKNAPPLTFGVFKLNLELLEDGTAVVVSIYPRQGESTDGIPEKLGLRRGGVVALLIGKSEHKDGQRRVNGSLDNIWMLSDEEERKVRAA